MNDKPEPAAGSTAHSVTPAADAKLDWQKLDSAYADHDLILFKTRFDEMRNPRTGSVLRRLVLECDDWVNLVVLTPDEQLVMIRQFRFGVGYTTLETPGGMVDPGEDSRTAAERELLEETGYGGGAWSYLGAVEPNPAIHGHLCHHWLVRGVTKVAEADLGDGEAIAVELMSEAQVRTAVASGELRHALALSALSRVFNLFSTDES